MTAAAHATPASTGAYQQRVERGLSTGLLHILVLLHVERTGPIHGYAMVRALAADAGSRLDFKEATVYAILKEIQDLGLLASAWADGDGGPARKYYTITAPGRRALDDAADLWRHARNALDPLLTRKPRSNA